MEKETIENERKQGENIKQKQADTEWEKTFKKKRKVKMWRRVVEKKKKTERKNVKKK